MNFVRRFLTDLNFFRINFYIVHLLKLPLLTFTLYIINKFSLPPVGDPRVVGGIGSSSDHHCLLFINWKFQLKVFNVDL